MDMFIGTAFFFLEVALAELVVRFSTFKSFDIHLNSDNGYTHFCLFVMVFLILFTFLTAILVKLYVFM